MVTFSDAVRALGRSVEVHIGVCTNPPEAGDLSIARATYQEHASDSNTGKVSSACLCHLRIEQYDELRALGAVEDGRLPCPPVPQ
jgi:hypothetical protein